MADTAASYGSKSVTTTASLLVAARTARSAVVVQNVSVSADLYVGGSSSVVVGSAGTASSGIKVVAGQSVTIPTRGDVYGIASAAATDVRYWEVF